MHEDLLALIVAAVVTAVGGAFGPWLLARLPEPAPEAGVAPSPDAEAASVSEADAAPAGGADADPSWSSEASAPADDPLATDITPAPPDPAQAKPLYVDLARRRGLAVKLGAAGVVVGGIVGWQVGWQPVLAAWVYLAVVGVVLAYIDAQTRLLPTRIIAPSYGVLVLLLALAALLESDRDALARSALGWLAFGGFYFLMWVVYPRGLGYGDVRLAGLLGLALGYLGWPQVLTGMYAGFLLGGVGGGLLSLLKVFDRTRYPFGPFMLLGAVVALIWGQAFADWYVGF